MNYITEFKEN